MTQEEKQLLLKDLCARLPYRPKGVKLNTPFDPKDITIVGYTGRFVETVDDEIEVERVRLYLRSMSSMTEEERKELEKNYVLLSLNFVVYKIHQHKEWYGSDNEECTFSDYLWLIDWLNEHHFDYRGLIEKGLALEAQVDIYKTE